MSSKNHYISFTTLGYSKNQENDLINTQDMIMNQELLNRISVHWNKDIKRGDTISVLPESEKYRNDWTFIWDGRKAVDLGTQYDEYGHVPSQFVVGDKFQPDHWHSTISHNKIFHLSDETKRQMKFMKDDHGRMYCHVLIGNTLWKCYISKDAEEKFDIDIAYFSMDEDDELGCPKNTFFAHMPCKQ